MNRDVFERSWQEMRVQVKAWWDRLTDDELERTGGKIDQLVGLLQLKYGYSYERAKLNYRGD